MLSVGSTSAAMVSSSPTGGSRLNSPTRDHVTEDNASTLTNYLHRVAGYLDMEVHAVVKDHCYARPWNWKPENIYVKPTRNIFFSSSSSSFSQERTNQLRNKLSNKDETIDVEHVDSKEQLVLPYNLARSRQCMDESEKLVNFVRPDENNEEDWEETVEKTFWSPIQRRLFTRSYSIFRTERLSRLTKINCATEVFHRRSSIDIATKRFREILASTGWDWRIIQWLHTSLIGNLSREYVVIYLDILQTLRTKIPQLIDRMITAVQPNNTPIVQTGSIPLESLNAVLKRSWDPISACLNANRPKKLPGNPILIVTSSGISSNLSSRQHKWITQLGALGMVVTVHSHFGLSANRMTMTACMDQLVQGTRAKIQDVRNDYPGRPMILIGLNTGAALACQIAQMEHVTAVVCLGFPFSTVEGKRGSPDDMLMDIRCPVMFVIGQNANLVRSDDLENVRARMLVETSLVVVGTADDHLRVSTAKIMSEGITQTIVDRCILDEIGDFVGGILLQPHPLPLRPSGSLMNFDKITTKREPRKRKNSTSSSVDSESNSPNVNKKLRPCVPINRRHSPVISSNSLSISKPSIGGLITASESATHVNVGGGFTTNVTSHSNQRRNSKVPNNQKLNNIDQLQLARQAILQNNNLPKANGGLTLNIGSLASLAPIGPIRLAPNSSCPSTPHLTAIKSLTTSKLSPSIPISSPSLSIPVTKMSKMIQTGNSHNLSGKLSNSIAATNKILSKSVGTNSYNKNINIQEQAGEAKLVTVFTSGGNQVRVGSASNTSTMQAKSIGSTTAPLTALLHSRKSSVINNSGKAPVCTPTTILLTSPGELSSSISSCSTMTTGTSISTTMTTTKVMESSSQGAIVNFTGMKNVARKLTKSTSTNFAQLATMSEMNKNTFVNQITKLPWLNKANDIQKIANNSSMITINSTALQKNSWDKSSTSSLLNIGELPAELDDDLGNLLDIPIIFAKDGDNLNEIEKTPSSSLSFASNTNMFEHNIGIQVGSMSAPATSTSTTVVLLSNKNCQANTRPPIATKITNTISNERGSTKFMNTSDILNQHATSQTCIKNPSMSTIVGNRSIGLGQTNLHCSTVNSPTIKYTKIILSKRNTGAHNTSSNQVILTKNNCKLSSAHLNTDNQNQNVSSIKVATGLHKYDRDDCTLNTKKIENSNK